MKNLILPFAFGGLLALGCACVYLQAQDTIDFTTPPRATVEHIDSGGPKVSTASEGFSHHRRTLDQVRQAVSESDLDDREKRRILRKLRRPWVAVRVTDLVTSEAFDAGVIGLTDDAQGFGVDWDSLLEFIERLLPLILQLIDLFG